MVDRYSTEKEGTVEESDEDDIEVELGSITEGLKALEIVDYGRYSRRMENRPV